MAARIREPALSRPKQAATRLATSSTWMGPSASTIFRTSSASIETGASCGSHALLIAKPRVVRVTHTLIFTTGEVVAEGRVVATASGVFKILKDNS